MPKSRRRKISNYQRIQARNRRAKADASMDARAKAKEAAAAAVEEVAPEEATDAEPTPAAPPDKSRERARRIRQGLTPAPLPKAA